MSISTTSAERQIAAKALRLKATGLGAFNWTRDVEGRPARFIRLADKLERGVDPERSDYTLKGRERRWVAASLRLAINHRDEVQAERKVELYGEREVWKGGGGPHPFERLEADAASETAAFIEGSRLLLEKLAIVRSVPQ